MPHEKLVPSKVTHFFKFFYNGLTRDMLIWYAYEENTNHFKRPFLFKLAKVFEEDDHSKKAF